MSITKIKNSIENAEIIKKEPPQPLRKQSINSLEFPVDKLPPLLRDAILALHDKIQAPIEICAQSVLATANLVVQGYANILLPIGQIRPISCFFLTIAESGERKSSCDNEVLKAIEYYENILRTQYDTDIESWQNAYAAWERQRLIVLRKKDQHSDYKNKKKDLDDIGKKPAMPLNPLILCPDPTFEGLCKLMSIGQPSIGLFSSEGGQFLSGYGMKEENKIRTVAALSDIWDGKAIKRVRAGDDILILKGRRLCMHLMVQPNIAANFLSDPALKDQGILSRILVAAPLSAAGKRLQRNLNPKTEKALSKFATKINAILATQLPIKQNCKNELSPRTLTLDEPGVTLFNEFADHVERNIADGQSLESIRGLANKLPEHAFRIAATIALAEDIHLESIKYEDLKIGIEVVTYYANEALRLFSEGIVDPDILQAEKLLFWLHNTWKEDNISLPDVYQRGPTAINTKAKAKKTINILETHGWLVANENTVIVNNHRRKDTWKIIRGGD